MFQFGLFNIYWQNRNFFFKHQCQFDHHWYRLPIKSLILYGSCYVDWVKEWKNHCDWSLKIMNCKFRFCLRLSFNIFEYFINFCYKCIHLDKHFVIFTNFLEVFKHLHFASFSDKANFNQTFYLIDFFGGLTITGI